MANLLKHAELVEDENFRVRVQSAAVQAALQISGEDTDATHAKSQLRQRFARDVIAGDAPINSLAWAVAANATILQAYVDSEHLAWAPPVPADSNAIPDGDIEYVMATIWDDLSGAASVAAPA